MLRRLLLSTLLVGSLTAPTYAASVAQGDTLAENQKLRFWIGDSVKTLDPQKNTDSIGSTVQRQLFEGLMTEDAKGAMVPGVAESYEVSDDQLTYTFKLRDSKWSNGDPVTAGDFVYAWQRAVNPEIGSPYAWYIELMHIVNATEAVNGDVPPDELGVRAIDDKTLEVTLTTPTPYFIKTLSYATTLPVHRATVEEFGDAWVQPENIVTNGAYRLDDHTIGVSLTLSKSDTYWDAEHTVIDEVEFITIIDENIALTRYLAGELDWVEVLPTGQFPNLQKEYPDQIFSIPQACTYTYMFNLRESGPEALKDVRVRRALSLAINRDVIVDKVLQGGQRPAYSWVHWAIEGYTQPEIADAAMTQEERNTMAKELLAEAGYGPDNPLNLTLQYNSSESHKKIAIAAQQFWRQVGVNIELANYEWKVFLDRAENGDFEVSREGWCADYNEASTFLDYFRTDGYNRSKWSNAEYDGLLEEAKTAEDPSGLYQQAEKILIADAPLAPVYFYSVDMIVDETLRGVPLENVRFTWYAKDLYRVTE